MTDKSSNEELEIKDSQYKQLLLNIPGMVYRGRPDWRIEIITRSEEITGYPTAAFKSGEMNWLEVIHPDDKDRIVDEFAMALKENQPISQKYRIVTKEKEIKWVLDKKTARFSDKNEFSGVDGVILDITGPKIDETFLKESESKYRQLIELDSDAIYLISNDGKILDTNSTACSMLGRTKSEILQLSIGDIDPDFTHDAFLEFWTQFPFDESNVFETTHLRKDGSVVPIEISSKKFKINNEILYYAIARDITERKLAEKALKERDKRFQVAMEFANDGLFDWNLETNQVYYSPGWKKLLGYQEHEIENEFSEWERLTHPNDVKTSWAMLNELFSGQRDRFEKEFKMRHKDGHWVDILSRANIVTNESGVPIRCIGTHIDISQRKQAERDLLEQKIKAEQYLELASVMFIGLDRKGNVNLANKKAAQILECHVSEIMGASWFDIFIPETNRENVRSVFMELISGNIEPMEYYENSVITKDGKEKNIAWHNTVLRDDQDNIVGILGSGEDITIRKRLEDQILQSQKLEAISTLAGGIAHDFNNMLGVITGNISHALSFVNKDDELFEILADAQDGATKAQTLTQQFLTFSRGGEPIKQIAHLNPLIKESATFITRGANVRCDFDCRDDLWPLEVDAGQVSQVINNLLINAIQAMPDGGVIKIATENTNVSPENGLPLPSGKYLKATIKDQGVGIAKKHLAKIFDPFFTTKLKGSGLGLATAYSIITRHGGGILVDSELGVGSTFTLYLPASPEITTPVPPIESSRPQEKNKILIMDDQEAILKMVGRMLNRMGYETELTTDGSQAIEIYKQAVQSQNPFDLVILDLTVPGGMGGAATVKELLKIDPNVKAVVSSGYSNDPIMANFQDYGFCNVMPKPYSKNQLSEILDTIFGENQ